MRWMLVLAAVTLTAAVLPARASEWGTIIAGVSTTESVRAQYGGPTKTAAQKVDNYDTTTWVYEGAQAPSGLIRMVVDFGILQAAGYRRDVVRSFKLEPKPGVFNRGTVMAGWGTPDRVGQQGGEEVYFYAQGLVVIFAKDGGPALTLVFTPPQPLEPVKPSR